eukprot:maker-scaffold_1-snap-gene-29.38-mRNA-1 protein AED:0.00 eAED:0.00 QI:321/1/1/1/1/1/2/196/402
MALNVLIWITFFEMFCCILWGCVQVKAPKTTWLMTSILSALVLYQYNQVWVVIPEINGFDFGLGRVYNGAEIVGKDKMNAAVYTPQYGADFDITYDEEVSIPNHNDQQILVEVKAAGINTVDHYLNYGTVPFLRYFRKYSPGKEFSGVVLSVGSSPQCSHIRERKEVMGLSLSGTVAEYAVAYCKDVIPKPGSIDFPSSGSLPFLGSVVISNVESLGIDFAKANALILSSSPTGIFVGQYIKYLQQKGSGSISFVSTSSMKKHLDNLNPKVVLTNEKEVTEWVSETTNLIDTVIALDFTTKYFEALQPVLKRNAVWVAGELSSASAFTVVKSYFTGNEKKVTFSTLVPKISRKSLEKLRVVWPESKSVEIEETIQLNSNFSVWKGFSQLKAGKDSAKYVYTP